VDEMKAKPKNSGNKASERKDIRTIARAADVSITTVSRTMNGVATVNPRMAEHERH
jgi:LacI family transcriptional regulator